MGIFVKCALDDDLPWDFVPLAMLVPQAQELDQRHERLGHQRPIAQGNVRHGAIVRLPVLLVQHLRLQQRVGAPPVELLVSQLDAETIDVAVLPL